MKPRLLTAAALLTAIVALTACGTKDEDVSGTPHTEKLSVLLDYYPNADHAGIYAAQARGDFKRAGLDVKITAPSDPATPLKLVAAGRADLAISYEPELLLARDKGAQLVAIAALAQRPLTSVMALGTSGVKRISDLAHKTVGTAGISYQSAYLKTILEHEGVDPSTVKEVNVGFDLVPAMRSKKVAATLGAFWNVEGVQLARADRDHKPTIIHMEQVGVPSYDELVLVARLSFLRTHGQQLRRFIQALQAGTKAVRADPAVALDPLLKANPDLKRGDTLAEIKATLPALLPSDAKKPFGWLDPHQWEAYSRWMLRNKLVSALPTAAALDNEFLPGEGVVSGDPDG